MSKKTEGLTPPELPENAAGWNVYKGESAPKTLNLETITTDAFLEWQSEPARLGTYHSNWEAWHQAIAWERNRVRASEIPAITNEMKIAGARSIGNSVRWPNYAERAADCYQAMLKAQSGVMPPIPSTETLPEGQP